MLKVVEIKDTVNPDVVSIVMSTIPTPLDILRGYPAKSASIDASRANNKFEVGQIHDDLSILNISDEEPWYPNQEPLGKDELYWKGFIIHESDNVADKMNIEKARRAVRMKKLNSQTNTQVVEAGEADVLNK